MDESKLIERMHEIEALFADATESAEEIDVDMARRRIVERVNEAEAAEPPQEYRFEMDDKWSRKLLLAMLRRYGLEPYRYRGQARSIVLALVPMDFIDRTFWPEFERINAQLETHLGAVTERIVTQLHGNRADARTVTKRPNRGTGEHRTVEMRGLFTSGTHPAASDDE